LAHRLVTDHGHAATVAVLFTAAMPSPSEEYLTVAIDAAVPEGVDLVALPADEAAMAAMPPCATASRMPPPPRPPSLPAELRALDATFAGVRLVDTMVGICAINQAESTGAQAENFQEAAM
ncbi:unnamed protein product, partial [Urochloa humidicola]